MIGALSFRPEPCCRRGVAAGAPRVGCGICRGAGPGVRLQGRKGGDAIVPFCRKLYLDVTSCGKMVQDYFCTILLPLWPEIR